MADRKRRVTILLRYDHCKAAHGSHTNCPFLVGFCHLYHKGHHLNRLTIFHYSFQDNVSLSDSCCLQTHNPVSCLILGLQYQFLRLLLQWWSLYMSSEIEFRTCTCQQSTFHYPVTLFALFFPPCTSSHIDSMDNKTLSITSYLEARISR